MSFLLDTDVLSDDTKPQPRGKVNVWIEANEERIYTIAKRHNLTLVTRNTADFAHSGLRMLNPFL